MLVALEQAAIGSGLGAAVPPLSLAVGPGVPNAIPVESDERPMLVSMLLAGRIRPDSGRVLVHGADHPDRLRRGSALVDTPVVAEPGADIALITIVAEELAFASAPSSRRRARMFLSDHGLLDYAKLPVRALPSAARIRVFSELAVLRPGVSAIVVTSPERHGGEPTGWYGPLAEIAARGITVSIVTDQATADILVDLGATDPFHTDPLQVLS
ncbi:hypothetical protein [Lacisediminihabitans profunda]|uniref:ABC transporter ATP-binding protein n=1 Tax=Lacisediminihabitans profunda TaxID=2594790 RepID=A0A5C8UKI2_9MICO|nr:hypothetical protein [Lacisediminihabitans profunda]TXN28639.1 hypothetical protein FVP33_16765 [Lacisediminihabitans profunda]